jgi:hypothetical protein
MTDLEPVLERLAQAAGVQQAIEAHQQARGIIRSDRKRAHRETGHLAKCFAAAMQIWADQRAAGVSFRDRLVGLTQTLRAAWPQTREWKYLCQQCDDYGLVMRACPGDTTCGRHHPHLPHEFGTPCWCDHGRRHRERQKPSAEDFTAAGKSRPTKLGRF